MRKVLMLGGARTPIGELGGSLAPVSAVRLGVAASAESLRRAGISPDEIDEVIIGNVLQSGQGQNPARQVAIGAGVPQGVPAYTVNQVCGSGIKAIELAWHNILLGRADRALAGGIESMSQSPYILPAMRGGARLGHSQAADTILTDGLTDAFGQYHMGITAERLAADYRLTRQDQDRFAVQSHRRYAAALEAGFIAEEIVPIIIQGRKAETAVQSDERPRPDTSLEKLGNLRPAFQEGGTVTAGNASGINDGAAAVVLAAEESLAASGLSAAGAVLVRDVVVVGCAPEVMGLGPVGAVRKLMARNGLTAVDIDLWELNEAFAAQSLAVLAELGIGEEKVNVNGGAIAVGHPIGASGTRIAVSLMRQMKRQQARLGVATMCIGGGMGIALLLENL
ncbi:MAG: acetyl-CoA C-acyltransferase [Armatimonadetes bacterium]|nr:acetyl-CoA C-acyltransferase [Armatimonadota bacterium]